MLKPIFEGVALGGFESSRGLDVIDLSWLESIKLRGWILARKIAPSQFLRRGSFLARLMPWEMDPFFCESRFGALKVANRRFEAIRANRSNVMKMSFFPASRFVR